MTSACITWSGRNSSTSGRFSHVFILGLLLVVGLRTVESSTFTCPGNCTCDVWTTTTKLQNISCINVGLTAVPKDPVDAKRGSDVIGLNLSHNHLTTIERADFQQFSSLVYLDLSFNNITSIAADVFSNLTSLVSLNLAGNLELGFPSGIFTDSLLLNLNLSHNGLTSLPSSGFDALTQLQSVDLSYNQIADLPQNVLTDTIEDIDLSHNLIVNVGKAGFRFRAGVSIDLSNNLISTIHKDAFKHAMSLNNLNLSNNALTSFSDKILDRTVDLETLDLGHNSLSTLDDDFLEGCPQLEYLDISDNSLTSLHQNLLEDNQLLAYIDARNNNLNSLDSRLLDHQTGTLEIYLSGNPYTCDCDVRAFLYVIFYNTDQTLGDKLSITCSDNGVSNVFLDYAGCSSGALMTTCSSTNECLVQDSICSNNQCACMQLYYDNNGVNTAGGLCRPKQRLDFPCDMDAACEEDYSECRATTSSTEKCVCVSGYYDNVPLYLGGSCEPQVRLGEECEAAIMDAMCIADFAECALTGSQRICQCESDYYDNNTDAVVGGECVPKLPLSSACNETYQCLPANSECVSNQCECIAGYYDFGNSGTCRIANIRQIRDVNPLKPICQTYKVSKCDADQFYSCFNTNDEVNFNHSTPYVNLTHCEQFCFNKAAPYYQVNQGVCLCGNLASSSCCPYVTDNCNSRSYMGAVTGRVSAGIAVTPVPILTVFQAYTFNITTKLPTINVMRVNFGDADTLHTTNAASYYIAHTYPRLGQFNVTVTACDGSACDTGIVPVRVTTPDIDFYTIGPAAATVEFPFYNITSVTFLNGERTKYEWSVTDPDGNQKKARGCENDWTAHRDSCIKHFSSALNRASAQSACVAEGGDLLTLYHRPEKDEVPTALGSSVSNLLWTSAWQTDRGVEWGNGFLTMIDETDLDDKSAGDCVVLDPANNHLTSAPCTTTYQYVCRKDPVDCPWGDTQLDNGNCVVVSTTRRNYQDAETECENTYNGMLTIINSLSTHQIITELLQNNSITSAWIGLNDTSLEGYNLWSDYSPYNQSEYGATFGDNNDDDNEDCYLTTNETKFKSKDCDLTFPCICEYSFSKETVTVPVYTTGTPDIKTENGSNIEALPPLDSLPTGSETEILLFPGSWFSRSGKVTSAVFTSSVTSGEARVLSIQVYRPSCTGSDHLTQPACQSRFASCNSQAQSCVSSSTCTEGTYLCYYSETCKKVGESCTCASEGLTNDPKCTSNGTMPAYTLVDRINTNVTGNNSYFVSLESPISVEELDILAIQYLQGKNPVFCSNDANSMDQQRVYKLNHTGFMEGSVTLPTIGMSSEELTCLFHMNYVQEVKMNLSASLGSVIYPGQYNISVAVGRISKSFAPYLEEPIGTPELIYPLPAVAVASDELLGPVPLEFGEITNITVRLKQGTNVTATWVDGSTTYTHALSSSCTSAVSAIVPQLCNTTILRLDRPFTATEISASSTGNMNITITLINRLGSVTRILILYFENRIAGVTLSLNSSSLEPNTVAINEQSVVLASWTNGTGVAVQFSVDGVNFVAVGALFHFNCTSLGTKIVKVVVSNILGNETTSMSVECAQPANFRSCSFLDVPFFAAATLNFTFQVSCTVNSLSKINSIWEFADRPGNTTTTPEIASSTYHVVSLTTSFSTPAASISLEAIVQDQFEQVKLSSLVTIFNQIPSVTTENIQQQLLLGTQSNITAAVPMLPGNYGTVEFKINFGSVNKSMPNGSLLQTFATEGSFNVTVYAVSQASGVAETTLVTVYSTVSDLTLSCSGPSEAGTVTVFNASISTGNFVSYNFSSSEFNQTQTSSSFSFTFTAAGDYEVTVVAFNELTNQSTSITVIILASDEIRVGNFTVDGQSPSGCIKTSTNHSFNVNATHYDALLYIYDMGNGVNIPTTSSSVITSYALAGNFSVNVTVTDTAQSYGVSLVQPICVQEAIQDPVINISSPIGKLASSNLTVVGAVEVAKGTSFTVQWETNATVSDQTTGSGIVLSFASESYFNISANVSNAVSWAVTSKVVQVMNKLRGVYIICSTCYVHSGRYCVRNNTAATLTAMALEGNIDSVSWDLGNGDRPTSGVNASTIYTDVGPIPVALNVSNAVSSIISAWVTIYVEVPLTATSVSNYLSNWSSYPPSIKNLKITDTGVFQAKVDPSNVVMSLVYYWMFEEGSLEENTTTNIGRYNYTTTGLKSVNCTAKNSLGNVTSAPFTFYVVEPILSISVKVGSDELRNVSTNIMNIVSQNIFYTFVMSSPQSVPDTETYILRFKLGSRLEQSSLNQSITHNFSSVLNYTLEAIIQNTYGSYKEEYNIEVVYPLTGASITAGVGEDGNMTRNSNMTLTAQYLEGKYAQYLWYFSGAPNGAVFPSPNDQQSVTLNLTINGEYIVTVEIFNSVSQTQYANFTVVVMDGVEGLSITNNQSVTNALAKDSDVVFYAVVSSGTGLIYDWKIYRDGNQKGSSTEQTIAFTFGEQALYNVTLEVKNDASSATAYKEFYSLIPVIFFVINFTNSIRLTSVNEYAGSTGTNLVFYSNISNFDFLNFDWKINGSSMQNTSTMEHAFLTPGTYIVTLNASNLISSRIDTIHVVVQHPISGLSVSKCNSTFAVNKNITMGWTVTTGTEVSVIWEGNNISAITGSTASVNYSKPGTYNVNVTASNSISSEVARCVINIQGIINNTGIHNLTRYFENYTITFSVTGDNLSPATFNWTLSNGATIVTTAPTASFNIITKGQYTVSLNTSNEVSFQTAQLVFEVIELLCSEPVLSPSMPTSLIASRKYQINFAADITTGFCREYTSNNSWTIYAASSCMDQLTNVLPNISGNTPDLHIPKVTLENGTYCVVFQITYTDTPVSVSLYFNLTIQASNITAKLDGGQEKTISVNDDIHLSASGSTDPDNKTSNFTFSWSCTYLMPQATAAADAFCNEVIASTASNITVVNVTLNVHDTFNIYVTVGASGRPPGTAEIKLIATNPGSPDVNITCVSCLIHGTSSSKQVSLLGKSSRAASYSWMLEGVNCSTPTLTADKTTTGISSQNLVIKSGHLQAGCSYNITLQATNANGVGYASILFSTSFLPTGGSCTVSVNNNNTNTPVTPLKDKVSVNCQNFQLPDPTWGALYKVVAIEDNNEHVLYYGPKGNVSLYMSPWAGTSHASVLVKVYVISHDMSSTLGGSGTVTFSQVTLSSGQTDTLDFIIDEIMNNMVSIVKENNPSQLIQYCNALILLLNDQSLNDVGTASQRSTIRDLLATALFNVPRSVYDIELLSAVFSRLSEIDSELSDSTVDRISTELENLKSFIQSNVQTGMDPDDINTDYLGKAVVSIQNTLTSDNVVSSDSAVQARLGDYINYVPEISENQQLTSYPSETARTEAMVQKSLDLLSDLMIVQLSATVPDEATVVKNISGTILKGQHASRGNHEVSTDIDGVQVSIPADTLDSTTYTGASAYLIFIGSPKNSLGGDLNTKTVFASLNGLDGGPISVDSLSSGKEVGMYLFADTATAYEIPGTGLQDAPSYNPTGGANFSTWSRQGGKRFVTSKLPLDVNSALHYMVRASFPATVSPNAQVTARLYKDGHADGNEQKTLTPVMMNDNLWTHEDYTFFVQQGNFDSSAEYTIRVQATGIGTEEWNVSVAAYFSSCMFYNPSVSTWESTGCSPDPESIPEVVKCLCNHMTSYGGSIFVSPNDITFTDLTDLDIASNPVAIITCSVILFLYIVAVIACRRMDILDIKRISLIPLCGKDGSFKYEVTVVTGRLLGAGTTANVGIRICGEYGKSTRQHIVKEGAFKRNSMDTFIVAYDVNLGDLRKVHIWHDNSGLSPSWYLSYVIVYDLQTDIKYYFFANSWLSLEVENGSIEKEMKAAGSEEMNSLGRRFNSALFNSLADKHLWVSLLNRPAQSRFTRVQRMTCCVTLLYTFIGVNAMWYGLLKTSNTDIGIGTFGWEELILALVSNLMVFPISLGLVFLFKKSRSKSNILDTVQKPQTAQTLEIENLCDNSQSGSFESRTTGAIPYDLDRESTIDSMPVQRAGLRRSRHVTKTQRENTDDSMCMRPAVAVTSSSAKNPMWTDDNIMKWPESLPCDMDSRPSTSSTLAAGSSGNHHSGKAGGSQQGAGRRKKAEPDQLLEDLDKLEQDLKQSESRNVRSSGSKRSQHSVRRQASNKTTWEELEDILHSDDESVADSTRRHMKRGSTTSQSSIAKKFNPRADPKINNNGSRWPQARQSIVSASTGINETFEPSTSQGVTTGLRPGYYSEMTMESRDQAQIPVYKEKCTLPPWCVYIAYVLCFLLTTFSVIIVILYCFKFGEEESIEWVLACLLSLLLSILIIEPIKAVIIAVYVVSMVKNVERDGDDDYIDIEPSFDNSNEKIKDVKFKPISGFALVQAKEEGKKIHRMNIMLRQFFAYIFYLWVVMAVVYINFSYSTFLLHEKVETSFIETNSPDYVNYNNMTNIDQFWDWTENVLADVLHLEESNTNEEHGNLLGAARLRLIRSTEVRCGAASAANGLGASSLTDRTCFGDNGYDEDTESYGERWNDSSYNRSWKYQTASELGGSYKIGMMGTYGGGGYQQILGTTKTQTAAIIANLKDKGWVDLRTRAVLVELSIYSPGTDLTALVALLIEFPLTGGVVTSFEIHTQKLLWFMENHLSPLMVLECILLLVVVYSAIHIICRMREHRKKYFKELWNWYEMLTTLMTIVSIGMYLGCVVQATNTFNTYLSDQSGFTNFEHVVYVHVGMRYLHAWLLFLLMFKVVKQLRFIRLLHVYEKTLSKAVGLLLATGLIFVILLLVYAQVGNLMYGRLLPEFQTVGHSIDTLLVIIRGTFDFWPMLDHRPAFSHFYLYSYYTFAYGIMIALVIAILNNTYRTTKSQMYYKSTLEMQDYEMIDFMLKRFKLWAGFQKPKPAFRHVRFPGLPSISSRSSSRFSNHSSDSLHSAQILTGPEFSQLQLRNMMDRLTPTWQAVLKRFEKIEALEKEEEDLVRKAENEMKELNWKCRINQLEKEHKELLQRPGDGKKTAISDAKQRQSVLKKLASKDNQRERKAPATVTGASRSSNTPPTKENKVNPGRRPLSDQGSRIDTQQRSSSSDRGKLHSFFKSIKPSKPAWDK